MERLDKLANEYREGSPTAFDEICLIISELLNGNSEKIWHQIKSQTHFECRCLKKAEKALENFDPGKGKFSSLILSMITKERSDFLKRRRSKQTDSIDALVSVEEDGSFTPFEIADNRYEPDQKELENNSLNEKITSLARGDLRKEIILIGWSDGLDDSHLGKVLAHKLGGKSESHRKFIQRFKQDCHNRLASEVTLKA